MSFPVTNAYVVRWPVSIGFEDDGGVSVTIPGAPPLQIHEGNEPTGTLPSGSVIPPVCVGINGEGNTFVSIPSGVSVSVPIGKIEAIFFNGVPINPRVVINFPSGGTITIPRRVINGSNDVQPMRVKIDGLGATMDPLP